MVASSSSFKLLIINNWGLYVIVWIHHNGINEILLLFGVCGYLNATVSQKDTVSFPQHSGTQDESNLYFFL